MTVQEVETTITIGDQDVTPMDVETEIKSSSVSNVATITGYVDEPTEISRDDELNVVVNGDHLFTGPIKRATQAFDGSVTVEAYDTFYDIHDAVVVEQTEENRYVNEIARDLLAEFSQREYGENRLVGRNADPDDVEPGSMYVAPASEFPGGDVPTNKSWGAGRRGEALTDVLQELADTLAGVLWTDRRNVLRIEPYPPYDVYTGKYIKDTSSGKSSSSIDNVKRVIVESPSGGVGESPAVAYIERKFSVNAVVENQDIPDGQTIAIRQPNSATQTESEKRALSEFLNIGIDTDSGTVTFVGTADPDPWDEIRIPDHPRVSLPVGRYGVSSVKHVVNTSEGWTVDVSLTDTLQSPLEKASWAATMDGELLQTYFEQQEESRDIELSRTTTE